jgi:hypothetical protein
MPLPKRYVILRGVENSYKIKTEVLERPLEVWTLVDEQKFSTIGLKHWESGFREDSMHDWDWREGALGFYGHSSAAGEKVDLVLVYEK